MQNIYQIPLPLLEGPPSLELCAGAGGQALGLEQAGFSHAALVEIDPHACATLRYNRPQWNVCEQDLNLFDPSPYKKIDLLAGGLPCPPFSAAGKQLGAKDERNLFPRTIDIIDEIRPKAVLIENVRGFLGNVFSDYRQNLKTQLHKLGYTTDWRLLNASDFGVPQLRPRVAIIALRQEYTEKFSWPETKIVAPTVGDAIGEMMARDGWKAAPEWIKKANKIAPTIVGGSKKHGGPDLGPTRARAAWAELGVNGKSIAPEPPEADFVGMPRLTVPMVARLQGFPDDWCFVGKKTNAYKQVGNAFPPPFAAAIGKQIHTALGSGRSNLLKSA